MPGIGDLRVLFDALTGSQRGSMSQQQGFIPNRGLLNDIAAQVGGPYGEQISAGKGLTPASWASKDDYLEMLPNWLRVKYGGEAPAQYLDAGASRQYTPNEYAPLQGGYKDNPDGADLLSALLGWMMFGDDKGNVYGKEYTGPR